jgi:hypothetical protein
MRGTRAQAIGGPVRGAHRGVTCDGDWRVHSLPRRFCGVNALIRLVIRVFP